MRTLIASLLSTVLALPIAAARPGNGPITGQEAKAHIGERLQHSGKVTDKTRPFTTHLLGKKGDTVRPFTANNLHGTPAKGNMVSGTVNMKTGAVHTTLVLSTSHPLR